MGIWRKQQHWWVSGGPPVRTVWVTHVPCQAAGFAQPLEQAGVNGTIMISPTLSALAAVSLTP